MEKSIKRVEKLVHATSSTLAQMKFSLMFDDISGGKDVHLGRNGEDFGITLLDKFLETDDLNLRQNEFKMEANETLTKIDKILAPIELSRKNVKPLDRIKEINKKMNHMKLEKSKREETKQSRQKLLSLINEEKFSPGTATCKESTGTKQTTCFNEEREFSDKIYPVSRKKESLLIATKSPIIPKVELENRILETQEIVDRGFQTARQLAQKVENMAKGDKKDKTPSSDKTVSEINSKISEGKTESSETIKTVKCRRCFKRRKKREGEQINTRVIDIKRNEVERDSRANLQLQQLPSLHIRGELKVQKIHSLEIPASEEVVFEKTNTAISFLSHEQMEKEKIEKALEKLRKETCDCLENEDGRKYVECFNCGKLIKIRETWVDPKRIDEVLRKCNFNVFDPKIDEFVEKYRGTDTTKGCEENRSEAPNQSNAVAAPKLEIFLKNYEQVPRSKIKEALKEKKHFTLQDLSDQLCKKYKEEADNLAENHLKLDAILRNLFRKIEESKDVFETCRLLRNYNSDSKRASKLTATKPFLVNLPRVSLLVKSKQKKLDKKDVKNRRKSRTKFLNDNRFIPSMRPLSKAPKRTEETGKRISSLINSNLNKSFLPGAKEEVQERSFAFAIDAVDESKITKQISEEEVEEASFVASPSTPSNSNSCISNSDLSEKKIKKTVIMASVHRKNAKEQLHKSFMGLSTIQKKTIQTSNIKKTEIEGIEGSSATSSISSRKGKATYQTDFTIKNIRKAKYFPKSQTQLNSAGPVFINELMEKNFLAMSPSKSSNVEKDEKEIRACQTPSDKSENNYESDFESFTNEPEEKGDDFGDEETKINPVLKKLSTISEVNSGLEKKFSDEQKSPSIEEDEKLKCINQKEGDPVVSDISARNKNLESKTKIAGASMKSTPTEFVTSLRDILTALQDQFTKSETLAEKLTESSLVERKRKTQPVPIVNTIFIPTPTKLIETLQSSRKDRSPVSKTKLSLNLAEKPTSGRSEVHEGISSEEGGSSLGEIIASEGTKNCSAISNTSSISEESILNLAGEGKSSILVSSDRGEIKSISASNFVI